MENKKLQVYLMAFVCSICIGSLVYIWPNYKELWLFVQIITLPTIYYIGYEILMAKQKKKFEKSYELILKEASNLERENQMLKTERIIYPKNN